jgi:hypothetical protein
MADVKISQLPAATTPVDGTEVLPIVQSATTKQVSIANLTAGRAMSASSLTLTTPLAVTSGGTGISTTGAGTFVVSATANTISATATPTLGVQQTTQGTLTLANTAAGAWPVTLQSSNIATAAWTMTLPRAPAAANGYILTSTTTGVTSWTDPTALGVDLDVGTTAITNGTAGYVLFQGSGNVLQQNANFFWDNTNSRLGIGTASPSYALAATQTVNGDGAVQIINASSGTGAISEFRASNGTNVAWFGIGGTAYSTYAQIRANGAAIYSNTTAGIGLSADNASGYITFGTGSAAPERVKIASDGNVTLNSATFSPTTPGTAGNMALTGTVAMGSSFKRNRIINGNMQVWQRGTSGSSGFSADRWLAENTTSFSQQTDVPSGFNYSIQFANTSATFPLVGQRIESVNCADLVGQSVTLSFWAKNVSGSALIYSELYYANSTDNFAATTFIGTFQSTSSNPSSSWTYYTGTITNLPAGAANGIQVNVVRNNGSAATTRITGVQLEQGSVATPYERQIYSDQLAQCQRYYQQYSGNQKMLGHGYMFNATNMYRWGFPLGIEMRSSPTLAFSGDVRVWGGSGPNVASATSTTGATYTQTNFVDADIACAGVTTTVGLVGKIIFNTSTAYISLYSEL